MAEACHHLYKFIASKLDVFFTCAKVIPAIWDSKVERPTDMPRRSTRAQRRRPTRLSKENQLDTEKAERKQFDYRNSCFKGPFLVHLCDLDFGQSKNRLIEGGDNVIRLTQILNIQGCLRLSREFHVPVVVDAADWLTNVTLQEPTLVRGLRMGQIEVGPDYTLSALDHENVISAAREMFKELQIEDPWWVADIYVTGASKSATVCSRVPDPTS